MCSAFLLLVKIFKGYKKALSNNFIFYFILDGYILLSKQIFL